ncbi:MAG: flagellar basal body rod protein FlgC [Deltaproteobacteria bacterium]|nr:flagellar basal body rod protein FlgC [Deltaproteobacteria bacterium]
MKDFTAMDVLASGLSAQRVRMNLTAANLANAETTRTLEGGPYKRQDPVLGAVPANADAFGSELGDAVSKVEVAGVVADSSPPRRVYDPAHPDAKRDGYVDMPNISMIEEMVNMMTAARAYEADSTALRTVVDMATRALNIGR